MDGLRAARLLLSGQAHPGVCPICGPTVFVVTGRWLRDHYLCRRCRSIPRMRAIVHVLKQEFPDLPELRVFESSPGSASSDWLARASTHYVPSQFWADVPGGTLGPTGEVSEDLQSLTLPDSSVDMLVTQDVFEHVPDPDAALREISRVLAPGGAHVWTVPIFAGRSTVVRAQPADEGGVQLLMEADYHGNPLGGGSLVIHEWGEDLLPRIDLVSGLTTTRHVPTSWWRGIRGEMLDVLVSRKAA